MKRGVLALLLSLAIASIFGSVLFFANGGITGLQTANQPPTLLQNKVNADTNPTVVNLDDYFYDADGDSLTYTVDDASVLLDGSTLTFTPLNENEFSGDYTVIITVSDGVNTIAKPFTLNAPASENMTTENVLLAESTETTNTPELSTEQPLRGIISQPQTSTTTTSANTETTRGISDFTISADCGTCGDCTTCAATQGNTCTLTADISSTTTCITVANDNVTIDCAGFTITYDTGGTSTAGTPNIGITTTGFTNNMTVTECNIVDGNSAGSNGYGIQMSEVSNSTIVNNSISTNGVDLNYGVYLTGVQDFHNNFIVNNTVHSIGTGTGQIGIHLHTARNTTVQNNTVLTFSDGGAGNYGIVLSSSAPNSTITQNIVTTYGDGAGGNPGILIQSDNHTVSNNTISTDGQNANDGIAFNGGDQNIVVDNYIRTNGTSNTNRGVALTTAENNTISRNTIFTSGTNSNHGIFVDIGAAGNNITDTTVDTNGTAAFANYGIQVSSAGINRLTNITITTRGTDSHAIRTDSTSYTNFSDITVLNATGAGFYVGSGNYNSFENLILHNLSYWFITSTSTTNNVTNISFTTPNGTIRIPSQIEVGETNVNQTNLNIGLNRTFLNSTNISFFNTSANITLNGLSFANPRIMVDYDDDGTYVTCASENCTLNSYSGGTIQFNVSHFTSYAVSDSGVCPGTITTNTTLTENVSGTGTCVTFGANNIELDCNGYTILYNIAAGSTTGISMSANNGELKNCNIIGYPGTTNSQPAVAVSGSFNRVFNNNITANGGTTTNMGVQISGSTGVNNVTNNTITVNATTNSNIGLRINGGSNNIVAHNSVANLVGGISNKGINLFVLSSNNTVQNNTVYINGSGSNFGIQIDGFTQTALYNKILDNRITTNGTSNSNYGMSIDLAEANTIGNNTIITGGTSSGHGIDVSTSANSNFFGNNNITAGPSAYAVFFPNIANSNNTFDSNIFNDSQRWIQSTNAGTRANFTNTTFLVMNNGSITIPGTFALSGVHDITRTKVNITLNRTQVNSTNLSFLNTSSNITLHGLSFVDPEILIDPEDDGTYTPCGVNDCTLNSYSGGTIQFNVSHFTSYAIAEDTLSCGDTITANTTLTGNLTGTGGCLTIASDNLELDCAGNAISWDTSGNGNSAAITASSKQNITIKNCILLDTSAAGAASIGINLTRVGNSTILNNIIQANGTSNLAGIYASGGAFGMRNTSIINNRINVLGTADTQYGIYFDSSSNNTIQGNNVTVNGTQFADAIIAAAVDNNIIVNNTIGAITTSGNGGRAVLIFSSGSQNRVVQNSLITNTAGDSASAQLSSVTLNNFTDNVILSNGRGMLIQSNADHNIITNNTITSSGGAVLAIDNNAQNQTATNNTLTNTGGNYALVLDNANLSQFANNSLSSQLWISATNTIDNFTNTTFATVNGSLRFPSLFTLNGTYVLNRNNLNVSSNSAYLNSTNLSFLNTSAQITLTGITFTDPRPRVDFEDDGTFAACNPPQCTEISYTGGTYVFNVSSFTTYISDENATACGDTITSDTNLTQNISGTGTCLTIGADNVVLDCQGNTITYASTSSGNGISAIGRTNVTIQHCTIVPGASLSSSNGIYFENTDLSVIQHNNATASGSLSFGIFLTSGSTENLLRNNSATASSGNFAFRIAGQSNSNQVINNSGSAGSAFGFADSNYTVFGNNIAAGQVSFANNNDHILIENNTVRETSATALFTQIVFNATIRNNTAISGQQSGILLSFTNNSIVFNNTAISNPTGATSALTIRVGPESHHNQFANNTVIDYGAGQASGAVQVGVSFSGPSSNNTFVNTTILAHNSPAIGFTLAHNNTFLNTRAQSNRTWVVSAGTASDNNLTDTHFITPSGTIHVPFNVTIPNATNVSQNNLNVTSNNAFLNSTNLTFLNTSAQIILDGLSFTDPRPRVDFEDDGTFAACNPPQCTEVSYNGSTYVFDVSSFTTYISEENVTACDTITGDTTLTNNISSAGTCISFGADDITLDCNGYTITYANGSLGYGINISGRNNVVVKNCLVVNASSPNPAELHGILLNATNNSAIINTTVYGTGTGGTFFGGGLGIAFRSNSDNNNISNVSAVGYSGIRVYQGSYNRIDRASAVGNAGSAFYSDGNYNNFTNLVGSGSQTITHSGSFSVIRNITANSSVQSFYLGGTNNIIDNITGIGGDAAVNIYSIDSNISNVYGSGTGGVLIQASNVNAENITAIATISPAVSFGSSNTRLRNVTATTDSSFAILVGGSANNNNITDARLSTNTGWVIRVSNSENNSLANTTLASNSIWMDTINSINTNFTNTTFLSENATVRFSANFSVPNNTDMTSAKFNLTTNRIFVNTTNLSFINTSARVTLHNLTTGTAQQIVDFEDDGSYEPCTPPDCTFVSYNGSTIVFDVSHFTSFSSTQGGVTVEFNKSDQIDPFNLSSGTLLNYTINFSVTDGAAFNITINETYPAEVSYVTSNPSPAVGNFSWDAGNLSVNSTYYINVTVNVSSALANGYVLNNTVNATYQNSTGDALYINVTESTTIVKDSCPGTITSSFTLAENATSAGNCITFGADNIALDCAGYTITYDTGGVGNISAITSINKTNISIRNCILIDQSVNDSWSGAVNLTGVNNSIVENNTIYTNGTQNNYGIAINQRAYNNLVHNNTINTNGSAANNHGIRLTSVMSNNTVTNNTISTFGTTDNYGITLQTTVGNSTIANNTISTNGSGTFNYGVLLATTINNTVTQNIITTNGTNDNTGIRATGTGGAHQITNNSVFSRGTSANNAGIHLIGAITGNTISNNTVETRGTASNYGIILQSGASTTNVTNNTVRTRGTSTTNIGIYLVTTNTGSVVTNNNIDTYGTASNTGIYLQSGVVNNLVHNNSIFSSGSSTGNIGINTGTAPVTGNNFTNNTIVTNGTGSNYGIQMGANTNSLVANNTITSNGTLTDNHGIIVGFTTTTSLVTNNIVRSYGIDTDSLQVGSASNNNITNNSFFSQGTSGARGVSTVNADNNRITGNAFRIESGSGGIGVEFSFSPSPDNNTYENNTFNIIGNGSNNYGFYGIGGQRNTIANNTMTINGTNNNHGAYLTVSFSSNRIINNTFAINSTTNSSGIRVSGTSVTNNTINSNTIQANATSNASGIRADAFANYNNFTSNNITTAGTSSYGINIVNSNNSFSDIFLNNTVQWMNISNGTINNFTRINLSDPDGSLYFISFTVTDRSDITRQKANISLNYVTVNSTNITALNTSAQITFDSLTSGTVQPFVDYEDDGTYVPCASPDCTFISYNGSTFVFNVSHFTSFTSELGGVNATLNKSDHTDPINLSTDTLLNYSINFSVTEGAALNITINETYPANVSFVTSSPSPTVGNYSWSAGNLAANNTYQINITLNVSTATDNGSILVNAINATYQNSSGDALYINVTENTTVLNQAACPISITSNYTLSTNLSCTGAAVLIETSDVTFDCAGNTITFDTAGMGNLSGIRTLGRSNVTIRNCILIDQSINDSHVIGINFSQTGNSTIENNTVLISGTQQNEGLRIGPAGFNFTVNNNTLFVNSSDQLSVGIFVQGGGLGNHNITNNSVAVIASINAQAIGLTSTTRMNSVINNTIFTNGTSSGNIGLAISSGPGSQVTDNTITTNGTSGATGILLSGIDDIIISNNSILARGSLAATTTNGISIDSGSDRTIIENNTIRTNGTGTRAIFVSSSNSPVIRNNTLLPVGTDGGGNYGVATQISVNGQILNNTMRSFGTARAQGIAFQVATTNYTIGNNIIQTFATSSLSNAIDFQASSGASIVENNTLETNGLTTSGGIYFSSSNDNNVTNNTIRANNTPFGAYAIELAGGARNNITNNSVLSNGGTGSQHNSIALRLSATNNTIARNTFRLNTTGAVFYADFSANGSYFINNTILNSTSWFEYSNSRNEFNGTAFNTSFGIINLTNFTLAGTHSISRAHLDVRNNTAFLNSTNQSALNTSATITLDNIAFTDPRPLVDFEDDGTFAVCSPPQCTEVSYTGTTYVFNVSSFTTYTTSETPVCPGTITTNWQFNGSVESNATCVTFGADNIELDCRGNTINYSLTTSGAGADATNRNNITIKNCVFGKSNDTVATSQAVLFDDTTNSTILNNTIYARGSSSSGFELRSGSIGNTIRNNSGFTYNFVTIYLNGAENTTVQDNIVETNTSSVIYVSGGGNHTLSNNTAISFSNSPFVLTAGTNHNVLSNFTAYAPQSGSTISGTNSLIENGTFVANTADTLFLSVQNTTVQNVSIQSGNSIALRIQNNADTLLRNISATTSGTTAIRFSNANNTTIQTATVYGSPAIEFQLSRGNLLNDVRAYNPASSTAVDISQSHHNTIQNSIVSVTDGTSNGVRVILAVNNTINNVTAHGNPALLLETGANQTRILNSNLSGAGGGDGLRINSGNSNFIQNTTARANSSALPFNIMDGNNTFDNITALCNSATCVAISSSGNTIANSTINAGGGTGLSLGGTAHNLTGTIASNVSISGSSHRIINNSLTSTSTNAIAGAPSNTLFANNTISSGTGRGLYLSGGTGNNVTGNIISSTSIEALQYDSSNGLIQNNSVTSTNGGALVIGGTDNLILNNAAAGAFPISLNSISDRHTFRNIELNATNTAILLNNGRNNTFSNVTIQTSGTWFTSTAGATGNNLTSFTFLDSLNGSINITNATVTGTTSVTQSGLFIRSNLARINTTSLAFLNTSAQITLHSLGLGTAQPIVDYNDDGVFAPCVAPDCTFVSYNGSTFVFDIAHFTSFSSTDGGVNLTLTKTDSPDPIDLDTTTILTYQITVNVTSGAAHNITLNESYPPNVTFVNSSPAPTLGNFSWDGGNISNGTIFQVNITLNVSTAVPNGTILQNLVNITYQNSTGSTLFANVTENTTVANVLCPLSISADTTLISDIICPGTAVTISADNVALDCAGFSLNYSSSAAGNGVNVTNRNNITIRNCVINMQNATNTFSQGIHVLGGNVALIENNTLATQGTGGDGIFLESANATVINNVTATTTGLNSPGIRITGGGNHTVANTTATGTSGINMQTITTRNTIINSSGIAVGGSQGIQIIGGLHLVDNSSASSTLGIGFSVSGGTTNSVVRNTIASSGSATQGAVQYQSVSSNNTLVNVTMIGSGTSNGLRLLGIGGTIINSTATTVNGAALLLQTGLRYNITGFNATATGTGDAVQIALASNNNNFTDLLASSNSGNALNMPSGAYNNFTNLTLQTNGSWLIIGANSPNNFTSTTFDAPVNGSITFAATLVPPNNTLVGQRNLSITPNNAFLNSTALPFLNTSAQITLNGLALTTPNAIVDFNDDGLYTYCNPPQCTFVSFAGGTLVYNVSSFTSYSSSGNVTFDKTDSPDPVTIGGTLNYTLTINNTGADTIFNATVVETYPSGVSFATSSPAPTSGNNTFVITSIAGGTSTTINITLTVGSNTANGTLLNNTANLTFGNGVGQNITLDDNETTTVVGIPQLFTNKTDTPDPVAKGTTLNYTITVTNNGDEVAYNTTVVEGYPSGTLFVTSTPAPNSGNDTFAIGTLAPGASTTINITVNVSPAVTNGSILTNNYNVTFVNASGQSTTVTNSTTTTVLGAPIVISIKSDTPDPVVRGQPLNYSILINNTGDDTAFNVTLTEIYPAGVTLVATQPAPSSGNNTFTIGTLAPNESFLVNITVIVGSNVVNGTILTNTVNASFRNSSGDQGNANDTETTTVLGIPTATVTKTDLQDPTSNGSTVNYTITVTNTGDEIAYNVTVVEGYPDNTVFHNSSPVPTLGNNTFVLGNLAPGQSTTLNITLNISATFNGTLNNTVNLTFANVSGQTVTQSANASTTVNVVTPTAPGGNAGGGGGGGGGGGLGIAQTFSLAQQTLTQNVRALDRITFTVDDEVHTLTILQVTTTDTTIEVQSTPQRFTITRGQTLQIDANQDGTNDISVRLEGITYPRATITLARTPQQPRSQTPTPLPVPEVLRSRAIEQPRAIEPEQTAPAATLPIPPAPTPLAREPTDFRIYLALAAAVLMLAILAVTLMRGTRAEKKGERIKEIGGRKEEATHPDAEQSLLANWLANRAKKQKARARQKQKEQEQAEEQRAQEEAKARAEERARKHAEERAAKQREKETTEQKAKEAREARARKPFFAFLKRKPAPSPAARDKNFTRDLDKLTREMKDIEKLLKRK